MDTARIIEELHKQAALGLLTKPMVDDLWLIAKLGSSELNKRAALEFRVGDRVEFIGRRGVKLQGSVCKRPEGKMVHVDVDVELDWSGKPQKTALRKWRVSGSMLEPVVAAKVPAQAGR